MADNLAPEENDSVSMVDVLQEEKQLEDEANAVLGGSDDQNCTYPMTYHASCPILVRVRDSRTIKNQGYVSRQALYACYTCNPTELAGVCLACCLDCHEGHDLYELYTKRNFRCDCGNGKFAETKCKLYPVKDKENSKNLYNHNFRGTYCTCERPYPDPDDEIEDEMIQCVVCEDWYHGRHLGVEPLPTSDEYDEVVCLQCMKRYDFLWAYTVHSQETQKIMKLDEKSPVDIEEKGKTENNADDMSIQSSELQKVDCEDKSVEEQKSSNTDHAVHSHCVLKELQSRKITVKEGSAFWKDGWRSKLCQCAACMDMYKEKNVLFLCDESDTVYNYEMKGKSLTSPSTQYDKGMQALSSMNRIQQVEVLHGFNDMKTQLSDYLKKFVENGKVVREEDIREFFSGMEERKRQKTVGPIQYLCK